jgi:hypothetical protein
MTDNTMNTKRRELLPYGYEAFSGGAYPIKLLDPDVDTYNVLQERINSFIDAGHPVGEHLLNQSHFLFKHAVMNAQYRKATKC